MRLLNFLLFSEVVVSQMVLYNPQNIVMADVGATAVISCVSNATIEDGTLISWYKTSSKPAKSPKRVKACQNDNDAHKYGCKNSAYKANLEIYNVQIIDSGVYFCAYHYVTLLRFSNGTALIIRDNSTMNSSIHLLASHQSSLLNATMQLACVVSTPLYTISITWTVSGTHYKGSMASVEEPGGTRAFQNHLTLPRDTWNFGDLVTCEVWASSSSITIHWIIKERDGSKEDFTTSCKSYLGFVLCGGLLLLLVLTVHLFWQYKQIDKKAQDVTHQDRDSDGIVYAHLDMSRLTQGRKQQR
ncbi:uncharacterized protein LOC120920567 isoform X1 [Rana temporaria]|uniref:uncharacterized protein LOC120920567 isoform X1 n=1 Tax=Rana temporaria TaxID=8407 RepID=UPI001AACD20F|nr:uncharacterized protein LOC120920567 isoform X1 [Rana temporaria]